MKKRAHKRPKNPIQPLIKDEHGVIRFKSNAIVAYLLDVAGDYAMNRIMTMGFTDDDKQQFAQLIGYSLSGYADLSYADDEVIDTCETLLS